MTPKSTSRSRDCGIIKYQVFNIAKNIEDLNIAAILKKSKLKLCKIVKNVKQKYYQMIMNSFNYQNFFKLLNNYELFGNILFLLFNAKIAILFLIIKKSKKYFIKNFLYLL